MNKSNIYRQTYLNIEDEFVQISKFIYINDKNKNSQLNVYSSYIADLIIKTHVEIEAVCKEIYFDLTNDSRDNSKNLKYDFDCLKTINDKFGIKNKVVYVTSNFIDLTDDKYRIIYPLKGKNRNKSYQALKHDRYANLEKGNVLYLTKSIAALFLLNVYMKFQTIVVDYLELNKFDVSFGSKFFSLAPPAEKYVIDAINLNFHEKELFTSDDSPFICRCTNESIKQIKLSQASQVNRLKEYLLKQPEFKDEEFVNFINKKVDFNSNLVLFNYLSKLYTFRLNKTISKELPFAERLKRLTNTIERKACSSTNPDEFLLEKIDSENIEKIINEVAASYSVLVAASLGLGFRNILSNCKCEIILDNGNVKSY